TISIPKTMRKPIPGARRSWFLDRYLFRGKREPPSVAGSGFLYGERKLQTACWREVDLNRRDPSFSRVLRDFTRFPFFRRELASAKQRFAAAEAPGSLPRVNLPDEVGGHVLGDLEVGSYCVSPILATPPL